MNILSRLLRDERGYVLSAETVLIGTVGVLGATVGLGAMAESVNDELIDVAMAFRSLDQSYRVEARSGCGSWVAGSQFTQAPVEQSLRELRGKIDAAQAKSKAVEEKSELKKDSDGDPPPPKKVKPNKKKDKNQDEDDSV